MTVGEKIKKLRTEKGLSQREFARQLGYTDHTTIARAENDKVDLPMSKVRQIAAFFNVTPDYLMGWRDEPEAAGKLAADVLKDPALLQFVQDFQTLDTADRATVLALVSSLAAKKKD